MRLGSKFGPLAQTLIVCGVAVTAAMLLLGIVGIWLFSPSLRTTVWWAMLAQYYKREVAALPAPANGQLRHIEWDSWGFAGVGDTEVYLVFDPSNGLAAAAANKTSGRFPGLPCEVSRVRQLESGWYTVLFYSETTWEQCP